MAWSQNSAAVAPSRPEGQWQLRPPHQTQRRVRGGFTPPSRHPSEGSGTLGAAAGAVKEAAGAHNRRLILRGKTTKGTKDTKGSRFVSFSPFVVDGLAGSSRQRPCIPGPQGLHRPPTPSGPRRFRVSPPETPLPRGSFFVSFVLFVVLSPFQAARDTRSRHPRHLRFRDHPTGEGHRGLSDTQSLGCLTTKGRRVGSGRRSRGA